ncbi:helix-turn-helix domain-containing protein [Cellulomonas sp. C5510]|uniref:helix-turn-helix domain-containing protein n=1 Tax=Cellulomonas sp. C5510 TaxID=2871170 RepID=UPI001C96831B|nr:helix-turn-helix transcriptional regulator [Cellulomonas sp. C5510]QZN85750.1 helix-turn-helix domain-containing protein [Cellulomonas sp. C5510]
MSRGADGGTWSPGPEAAPRAGEELRTRLGAEQRLGAELRHARGLSQSALAERASVQQADVSRIERGLGNPTRDTLVRLADALGARLTLEPRADTAE